MFRLIIAGGRDFDNDDLLNDIVSSLLKGLDPENVEIISGMADGADALGVEWAKENNIVFDEFPADWKNLNTHPCYIKEGKYGKYNALAGHNRNQNMADAADALVAFWDGKSTGTKDMIDRAYKAGITVTVIDY